MQKKFASGVKYANYQSFSACEKGFLCHKVSF